MRMKNEKTISTLTVLVAIGLAVVSFFGAFQSSTYERDTGSMAVQGAGQDMVDLFLIVPLLILTLICIRKGSRISWSILAGAVCYIAYSFFIYTMGVHFNTFFLLYCFILGTSLYTFILIIIELNRMEIQEVISEKAPRNTIAIYFLFTAAMFYLLWMKDIVPAILTNTVPKSVSDYNLLVNPVHVLDISIVLPGFVITSLLLFRRHKLGYIFTPILLVFTVLLAIALIAMLIMLKIEGLNDDISTAVIFAVLSIASIVLFYRYFKVSRT